MKSKILLIAMLCWLLYQPARSQTTASQPANDVEAADESAESVDANAAAASSQIVYTVTSGTFETSGRVLLYSLDNSAAASFINQAQAEKSGLAAEPREYALEQNFPNPFNPSTTIRFTLREPSIVTLKLYNTLGQEVKTLLNNEQIDYGDQEVVLNANNFASGVYFYRLVAQGLGDGETGATGQNFVSVKKMVLIK
ncbi:MAG: T9SS type A sorting domain-containing protein [Bacteroidota bacterium]